MIIRNDIPAKSRSIPWSKWVLGLFSIGLIILVVRYLPSLSSSDPDVIICTAEKVDGLNFIDDDITFGNGNTQSSDRARTGKYSSYLNEDQKYGMRYSIKNFKTGNRYCAAIWKWSESGNNGYLAVQGNEGSDFFIQENTSVEMDPEGWIKYELCFTIPNNVQLKEVKIFPYYTQGEKGIYFDDLTIQKENSDSQINSDFLSQMVQLYINDSGISTLRNKRDQAIQNGLLQTEDEDWVDAHFIEDEIKKDAKIRLKGDWTDHLEGNKWSYRVKLKSTDAWNRMQVFSLQSPDTRDMLSEWVYHQMLIKEDVLTPRYDFIKLKINDNKPNVYAYEEHFTKLLPEYRNRREGPIVKYSEDAVWQQRLRSKMATGSMDASLINDIYNSEILPFGEGKIVKDTTQAKLFISAQTLMNQMKFSLKPMDEILDIDRMARFFAIMDILGAHHSIVWHNLRFYYNPVTQLLEPIGFDGYTADGSMDIGKIFYGQKSSSIHNLKWMEFLMPLYRNRAFAEFYAMYLGKYSSESYISSFYEEIQSGIKDRERFVRQDFPAYRYDKEKIEKKAKSISAAIQPYNDFSLRGFIEKQEDRKQVLLVTNYHLLPLILDGIGNAEGVITPLDTMINSNDSYKLAEYIKLPYNNAMGTHLHYHLPGSDKRYSSQIKRWDSPGFTIGSQQLGEKLRLPIPAQDYEISNGKIIIKPGQYVLQNPILIPAEYSLELSAGVSIDLQQGSFILVRGPLNCNGKKDYPVSIKSSDKSGQGVFVLGANNTSVLSFVTFDGLTNLNYQGWQLTGALTFYESDVEMTHVTIIRNNCEDALNIIRSSFDIEYLHLSDTKADGFDADFCSGEIRNAYISQTGNDGLDFSGSVITVKDCAMNKIGDKGLSAGEQATVHIKNTSIEGADIGIASKDLSSVRVENVRLINCDKGFAVYQKKPEYGPAKIDVISYTSENVKHLKIEEEGSVIKIQTEKQ